ncbi:MAG: mannitol-1-phosphate 5-dehydrogenase [Treponema sp.]|jgi:mannitol-1-phosphate 5-dehydrogenase|nr:mannitol-1-phosphate 5-dehydrogenase [Treponema sp.]
MKMVMYGCGNIGRGFIGALFAVSGYDVVFIDIADALVDRLHSERKYPVRVVSDEGFEDIEICGVDAVNGKDTEKAAALIAEADIMATAVGVNALKFIAPVIAGGVRKRLAAGGKPGKPLNIIICENLMDANVILGEMIRENLSKEEREEFDKCIGLVEASIGRMVPVQTPEMQAGNPLRVCVERYGFLPVDRDAFRGGIPEIKNLVPFSPFDFYLKRKLYVHNMGHAVCAYLGGFTGFEYIRAAVNNPDIRLVAQNAMLESARALSIRYNVPIGGIIDHIDDLLLRFSNAALRDTCRRVGADPVRKLSPRDRLVGAASFCLEQGICPAYTAAGAAGAVYQQLRESGKGQSGTNAGAVLESVSALRPGGELWESILKIYDVFRKGGGAADIRRAAELLRAEENRGVV